MSLNENTFFSNLSKKNCFEKKPHIAVGVSGGPDSMALIYLLNKWVKFKKGKLSALVFDHGIRNDSKKESFIVKNTLEEFNIKTFIIRAKRKNLIKKNMAQARNNRFDGLISFCKKNNILQLFLGHHFDDNLETYLIRRLNGSNLEGLNSMKSITHYDKIQILRPLLSFNKTAILNYNKKNKILFINDPSNKDINFTRTKVRNFLLNKGYKKSVNTDFLYFKEKIPNYKKMIWELFLRTLVEVKKNKIKINFNEIIKIDELIIEKHILLILQYFSIEKFRVKSSKINILLNLIKKPDFDSFNLSGIIIRKRSNFLIFFQI